MENNNAMIKSYIMIDPMGRFLQNTNNIYQYSRSFLEVGVLNALNDIKYDLVKFMKRGGVYAY